MTNTSAPYMRDKASNILAEYIIPDGYIQISDDAGSMIYGDSFEPIYVLLEE